MKIEPRTFTLPNGEVLTVRSVSAADAETYCKFKNTTYRETHFLRAIRKKAIMSWRRFGMVWRPVRKVPST